MGKKKVNVTLNEELWFLTREKAFYSKTSASSIIEELLAKYLNYDLPDDTEYKKMKQEEKEAKEKTKKERKEKIEEEKRGVEERRAIREKKKKDKEEKAERMKKSKKSYLDDNWEPPEFYFESLEYDDGES